MNYSREEVIDLLLELGESLLGNRCSREKLRQLEARLQTKERATNKNNVLVAQFITWLNEVSGLQFKLPESEEDLETDSPPSDPVHEEKELKRLLQTKFGHETFRPGQKKAIKNVLSGQHCLLVMPTGGGKSLCYQLPALVLNGTALVISPLISLMKDQVDSLKEQGISVTNINSSFARAEQLSRLDEVKEGLYDLVYVAPERLEDREFQAALEDLEIDMLAIDEAHCISKWGYDFRPAYRRIPEAHSAVGEPPVLATTATATPQVQNDIRKQLELPRMQQIVKGFNRPNLYLEVQRAKTHYAKREQLADLLNEFPDQGSAIVYVGTRDETMEVAKFLEAHTDLTCHSYHGGMEKEKRKAIQRDFLADRARVMVATNAFGMGIDKPDIRAVIHYRFPGTVEAYYQEAGRAGRDGKPARCLLYYRPEDKNLQEWFIRNDAPRKSDLFELYDTLLELEKDSDLPDSAGRKLVCLPENLMVLCDLTDVQVQTGLSLLTQADWLEDNGYRDGKRHLKLKGENYDRLEEVLGQVRKRRRRKRKKLRKMVEYAETTACRRKYILDYFGDDSQEEVENCCDNCTSPVSETVNGLKSTEKLILATVAELESALGVQKIAMILAGSEAQSIRDQDLDQLKVYGKLDSETQQTVQARTNELLDRELLRKQGEYRPVIKFTERGRQLFQETDNFRRDADQTPGEETSDPPQQGESETKYPPL